MFQVVSGHPDKPEGEHQPTVVEAVSIEDTGEIQEAQEAQARSAVEYEDSEDDLLAVESQVAESRDSGIDSYGVPEAPPEIDDGYGAPQAPVESYGPPEAPPQSYGPIPVPLLSLKGSKFHASKRMRRLKP